MQQDIMKQKVAAAAIDYITWQPNMILGIGSGSTVNCFIRQLEAVKHNIAGAVVASSYSAKILQEMGINVVTANEVSSLDFYVDGADEVNNSKMMVKGGGAALTGEKIVAALAKKFICIVDKSKQVDVLGSTFPLPIEVIPMARSYVARQMVALGGVPEYRTGVVTDYGNVILDIHNLKIMQPMQMEAELNNIAGVVTNGIFALRPADVVIVANGNDIEIME